MAGFEIRHMHGIREFASALLRKSFIREGRQASAPGGTFSVQAVENILA